MQDINALLDSLTPQDMDTLRETAKMLFPNGMPSFGGAAQPSASTGSHAQNSSQQQEKAEGGQAASGNAGQSGPADGNPFGGMPDFANILSGISPEMLQKIMFLMQKMNQQDTRYTLIQALKPHLSEPRQKKADQAMQMVKLMELMPFLQEAFGEQAAQ